MEMIIKGAKMAVVVRREIAKSTSPLPDVCHIVLEEPGYGYKTKLPREGWRDSIVFQIHDITREMDGYVHFTEEMGVLLIDFIRRNEGANMLVNCDAGMSRSVAVGCILRD